MKKGVIKLVAALTVFTLGVGAITWALLNKPQKGVIDEKYVDDDGYLIEPIDIATHIEDEGPTGNYDKESILVKNTYGASFDLIDADIKSVEYLYEGSNWQIVTLNKPNAIDVVKKLRKTNLFEKVDYNYLNKDQSFSDPENNAEFNKLGFLETMSIEEGWQYCDQNDLPVGGSPDIVVAVIDSGVDYNHNDLRNNIWTNAMEIPNNGVDDDGNGYIDDICGWDFVNNDNDPIDDNGHGTHVAGSIAAENNDIGIVGIAFNSKIMVLKAANSAGYLLDSDIAKAVQYAYMNGASVINMSFGSNAISIALQDTLINAYNQCTLVAAAGNEGMCAHFPCQCRPAYEPHRSYPAALSCVVGVMSTSPDGQRLSLFSNYAHSKYYDVFAPGEQIYSTWPGNKYKYLNGTSMACPQVAGIAAVLRSIFRDRDVYPPKFINSQLVNTGTTPNNILASVTSETSCILGSANLLSALTSSPKPQIIDGETYLFDSVDFSANNNGNSLIEAGETIRIAAELYNRGGKAANISATLRSPNEFPDPHITITNNTISMNDIGTYSTGGCGLIYDGTTVVGTEKYFEIEISDSCPGSYQYDFVIDIEYNNGLDNSDSTVYEYRLETHIIVNKGVILPYSINQDTTLQSGYTYILPYEVTIEKNVTVTVEAGAEMKLLSASVAHNVYLDKQSTISGEGKLTNYGTLNINGTVDKPVDFSFLNHPGDTAVVYNALKNNGNICAHYLNFGAFYGNGGNGYFYDCSFASSRYVMEFSGTYFEGCYFKHFNVGVGTNEGMCGFKECLFVDGSHARTGTSVGTETYLFESNYFDNSSFGHQTNNYATTISIKNNVFYDGSIDFSAISNAYNDPTYIVENNKYLGRLQDFATNGSITGYRSNSGDIRFDFLKQTNEADYTAVWPHVSDLTIYNSKDEETKNINVNETFRVVATFNRDMDTTKDLVLSFGSVDPYFDYSVPGTFVSSRVWEGEYEIKSFIEGGFQYFRFAGAESLDRKTVYNNGYQYSFNVVASGLDSMTLQAVSTINGVELTWVQDDYDTLMGYNIYRSDLEDGNYVRINPSLIPSDEDTFVDDSCQPGKQYWYTFTVVLSDFSESAPAGKVSVNTIDTINPTIYHTPVNQGYAGNNLVVMCSASDNIGIVSATLHYRTVGETNWKTLPMVKTNDRYSAVILGSEISLLGLEYYISVSDGVNTITRGTEENPFVVIIKEASSLNNLGDVDGDGVISAKDALMIIKAINDEIILTDDQFQRADLNKDGELSTFEALRILQYLNGNVTTLEM